LTAKQIVAFWCCFSIERRALRGCYAAAVPPPLEDSE
jgi:hypothetical protein